jgi:tRNA (guanine-N7-)-methyltransferase
MRAMSDSPLHRPIRSFVKRGGRITTAQSRALADLWPVCGVEFTAAPLDLDQLFGRRAPRCVEIGFGSGDTLVELAARHPEMDFLGIEVHPPGIGHCLLKMQELGLRNLRISQHDAVQVLEFQIPPASLTQVLVYFPDPWHKKRHHKRRLIQPEFAALAASRLVDGGTLHLATDWQPYAEQMLAVLGHCPEFTNVAAAGGYVPRPASRPVTRFERRGERLGHGVWDLEFRRVSRA